MPKKKKPVLMKKNKTYAPLYCKGKFMFMNAKYEI